jgi:hypothetical protein
MQVKELGEAMTRTLFVFALLAFAAGAAAQPAFRFVTVRVTGTRGVYDMQGKITPMQAHYILDEHGGVAVCTRVLFHENGQFAAQEMPVEFCR